MGSFHTPSSHEKLAAIIRNHREDEESLSSLHLRWNHQLLSRELGGDHHRQSSRRHHRQGLARSNRVSSCHQVTVGHSHPQQLYSTTFASVRNPSFPLRSHTRSLFQMLD
jgi:hypothetical protein